jgi:hypothetical protein
LAFAVYNVARRRMLLENMDKTKRFELIEKVKQQGIYSRNLPDPVVSLEDFFTGNDDPGSIGCNTDHSGPKFFKEPLLAIRAKPNVQDVLIEIYEVEEEDETIWPFSERIYILTSASREEVQGWLAPLTPDSVEEGFAFGVPIAAPPLWPDVKVYAVWWD